MKIRSATASDIKEIAENEKSSFSIPLSEKELEDILKNPLYRLLVADDGGYKGHSVFYITEEVAEIVSVAVKSDSRNCGIGKAIIKKTLEVCKEEKVKTVLLEVRVSNGPAIALYESVGFEKMAERPRFYEKPEENAYTMKYESEKHR